MMIKLLFSLSVLCVAATGKKDIGLHIYLSREREKKKWKDIFKRKKSLIVIEIARVEVLLFF